MNKQEIIQHLLVRADGHPCKQSYIITKINKRNSKIYVDNLFIGNIYFSQNKTFSNLAFTTKTDILFNLELNRIYIIPPSQYGMTKFYYNKYNSYNITETNIIKIKILYYQTN